MANIFVKQFRNDALKPLRIYEDDNKFYVLDNENVVRIPTELFVQENFEKSWFDTKEEAEKFIELEKSNAIKE